MASSNPARFDKSLVQWLWASAPTSTTSYDHGHSLALESAFQQFLRHNGSPSCTIHLPPGPYEIDFIRFQQHPQAHPHRRRRVFRATIAWLSASTGQPCDDTTSQALELAFLDTGSLPADKRRVSSLALPFLQPNDSVDWQYLVDDDWHSMDNNDAITAAYTQYLDPSQQTQFASYTRGTTTYRLYFSNMTQRNTNTGFCRPVRVLVPPHGELFASGPLVSASAGGASPPPQVPRNYGCPEKYLSVLQRPSPPSIQQGASRIDALLLVAHVLLWHDQAHLCIYGGFVRDLIVRQEEANDIDVKMPDAQLNMRLIADIRSALLAKFPGCRVDGPVGKGQAKTLKLHGPLFAGKRIDVDFTPNVVIQQPGADCSAGNLMLEPRGKLALKAPQVSSVVDVATSVQHALNKQFVFFYAHTSKATPRATYNDTVRRLTKYFGWGWTCLSPLPPDVVQAVQGRGHRAILSIQNEYKPAYTF
eukprot:m.76555 g.76555  ORF g.76555 m.76555 type:complete len:475 (+) comp14436_c0_seq1:101-1525(+)